MPATLAQAEVLHGPQSGGVADGRLLDSYGRRIQVTRRPALDRVLAGLEELERHPTIRPIKVNAVAMRHFTEEEVVEFARLARRKPYVIRFIEFMPLDADGNWERERVLTGAEIRAIIERDFMPLVPVAAEASSTSRRYTFADGVGEIG